MYGNTAFFYDEAALPDTGIYVSILHSQILLCCFIYFYTNKELYIKNNILFIINYKN